MDARSGPDRAKSLQYLRPERGGVFVDCTVGLGGHARALLEAGATRLLGLDRDRDALALRASDARPVGRRGSSWFTPITARSPRCSTRARLRPSMARWRTSACRRCSWTRPGRGFSFQRDEPLDMRMDQRVRSKQPPISWRASRSATWPTSSFSTAKNATRAGSRARSSRAREESPIDTTGRLAAIVRRAIPRGGFRRIDPATRTFQALRIWVNRELEGLERFVKTITGRLRTGARLAIITFHSLEDRIVKHTFRALERQDGGGRRC